MVRSSRTLRMAAAVPGGPDELTFATADGLCSPDEFRPAELALANAVPVDSLGGSAGDGAAGDGTVPADDAARGTDTAEREDADDGATPDDGTRSTGADLLVVDANYGVVATALGLSAGTVRATETSARAARYCRQNCRANGVDAAVELGTPADLSGRVDVAAYAPRPYDPVAACRERAVAALDRLCPGGHLYVAGRRTDGIDRYRETLAEFAPVDRVRTDLDCRVYRARRPADLSVDLASFVDERTVRTRLRGHDLEFRTQPGLFSPGEVDRGTRLLAETALDHETVEEGDRLLDLACGYGPLGIAAAVDRNCRVTLTDDSRPATRLAERNCRTNGVDPVAVTTADCADGVDGPFDVVVSNPPTHAGREVTSRLFAAARDRLVSNGAFWLVYNETMGYEDRLPFREATVVRRADGYAVTVARP